MDTTLPRFKGRFITEKQLVKKKRQREGGRFVWRIKKELEDDDASVSTDNVSDEPRQYATRLKSRSSEFNLEKRTCRLANEAQQEAVKLEARPGRRRRMEKTDKAEQQDQPRIVLRVKKEQMLQDHYCHACQQVLSSDDIDEARKNTSKTVLFVSCRHCNEINSVLTGDRPASPKSAVVPSLQSPKSYPCQTHSKEENDFYKLTYGSDVAAVRFLKLHCTSCDEHIGSAPSESHNVHEHPILRTLLCAKCRDFYGDGTFEQGDDATDMFCRWCANGGNLYCCSFCSNTFCSKCIKRNFDPPTIKRIEAEDTWKCFVCDPKDLYPLRSITRALMAHLETVIRILENSQMSPKEIEEKMHLDESKCCSRKRKRRRRRTASNSDDDEEDISYVPDDSDRPETPPTKKRKVRNSNTGRNSNGWVDHEYSNINKHKVKSPDTELDPADLMMTCEQSMIEGDSEIINPAHVDRSNAPEPSQEISTLSEVSQTVFHTNTGHPQRVKLVAPSNMAINPVPLANLLKVALSTGARKIKLTHPSNQKLVAVPMSVVPKTVNTSNITFVKPPTHFLVPKNMTRTVPSVIAPRPVQQPSSVIDIDSDDEPVIVENSVSKISNQGGITPQITTANDVDQHAVSKVEAEIDDRTESEPDTISRNTSPMTPTISRTRTTGKSAADPPEITLDGPIPLKLQHRNQRFKKMIQLQSLEIDNTLGELKTKVMKLIQLSNEAKPQHDDDLLNSALVCTKRFHRALRKSLVELSHINDRVVKDYVHWKKKHDTANGVSATTNAAIVKEAEKKNEEDDEIEETVIRSNETKDDITLEMICVRDSESETEDDDDVTLEKEERSVEATTVPSDFSQILDHLLLFKRKPTSSKAVGDSSVITHDKACQAYDVQWRDYEKCIGYSLLTKADYDPKTETEILRPVVMPDENFGKYQEQYLYYLQHIEDCGIETDELKGLPDPNHIPLKDLIDSSSPFIMDMLERLSPVTLSNGCNDSSFASNDPDIVPTSPVMMDTSSSVLNNEIQAEDEQTEPDNKTVEDNAAPTSKAVEELVKMVTKLSEDLRTEQQASSERKETEESLLERDKLSILEVKKEQKRVIDDVVDNSTAAGDSSDECTTID